jgi:ribonuclease P protein component
VVEVQPRAFFGILKEFIRRIEREATVSTQTRAPSARAWISQKNALARRTQRLEIPSRKGSRQVDRRRQARQSLSQALVPTPRRHFVAARANAQPNGTGVISFPLVPGVLDITFRTCNVKRAWRLKAESDVQRVWQQGRAFAHPLVILRVRPNGLAASRAAFVAGKKLGNAVTRNLAKRHLRHALAPHFSRIPAGFDFVLIARGNIAQAPFTEIQQAVLQVLQRAKLLS